MVVSITPEELKLHGTESSTWIAIDGHVYDVTKFAAMHPGGEKILTVWLSILHHLTKDYAQ